MHKKLYIETSVWNQLFQDDAPGMRNIAERFMAVAETGIYDLYISDYVLFELDKCEEEKRAVLLKWIERVAPVVLTPDEECEDLMRKYFTAGVMAPTKANKYYDAAHVAIASVSGIAYLLTFNYRHMLKIKKIEGFNGVNMLNGYGEIHLVSPELFILEEDDE
jgi:predicted nucleic acid-binding protein